MSAEDFERPGEPTQAHWRQALRQMTQEGNTLKRWVDSGKFAKDYFDAAMERAAVIMRTPKPLPLPPRPLPLPPRALPLPPGA